MLLRALLTSLPSSRTFKNMLFFKNSSPLSHPNLFLVNFTSFRSHLRNHQLWDTFHRLSSILVNLPYVTYNLTQYSSSCQNEEKPYLLVYFLPNHKLSLYKLCFVQCQWIWVTIFWRLNYYKPYWQCKPIRNYMYSLSQIRTLYNSAQCLLSMLLLFK